jgi:hypothetical protein
MRKHQLAILAGSCLTVYLGTRTPPVSFKVESIRGGRRGRADEQGRFVSTLGKDDFQILEDGRPRR